MSIEHKLDVKQINEPDYQTKHKGFLNKAKYFLALPLIAATIACSTGYKTIEPNKNTEIRINEDFSSIILKTQNSRGEKRTDVFRGDPIEKIEDYHVGNLELIETKYNPKGLNNTETSKINSKHIIDQEIIKRREHKARKLLENYYFAITNHIEK